jgi:hypothetical protein
VKSSSSPLRPGSWLSWSSGGRLERQYDAKDTCSAVRSFSKTPFGSSKGLDRRCRHLSYEPGIYSSRRLTFRKTFACCCGLSLTLGPYNETAWNLFQRQALPVLGFGAFGISNCGMNHPGRRLCPFSGRYSFIREKFLLPVSRGI